MDIESTLEERRGQHGDFEEHAICTQKLKGVVSQCLKDFDKDDEHLLYAQQEAIDMIFHKVGRIVAGDPNVVDHWHDIAGYALLVERILVDANPQSE